MFVVRILGGQFRESLVLNVIVFVVRILGGQCRESLVLNVTVFFSEVQTKGNIERN